MGDRECVEECVVLEPEDIEDKLLSVRVCGGMLLLLLSLLLLLVFCSSNCWSCVGDGGGGRGKSLRFISSGCCHFLLMLELGVGKRGWSHICFLELVN